MILATDMVASALKLTPEKNLPRWSGEPTSCSLCTHPIVTGEQYSPFKPATFFANTRHLGSFSQVTCWRCVPLQQKPFLDGLTRCVITEDAIYDISKDSAKAWLFLTPPNPPFAVVVLAASNATHQVWRAPVTFDNRRIAICNGDRLFQIRPDKLQAVVDITDRINEGRDNFIYPLITDRDYEMRALGRINPQALDLLKPEEVALIRGLSAGERWALAFIIHPKMPKPVAPPNSAPERRAKIATKLPEHFA